MEAAHRDGFRKGLSRREIPSLCDGCHGDPGMMRPYNLPTDQHALYRTSQHGKAVAASIIELFGGRRPEPPTMVNTCYSFVDDHRAIHVSSVHRFDENRRTLVPVSGAGGVSPPDSERWSIEGRYASGWAQTIWADMLA